MQSRARETGSDRVAARVGTRCTIDRGDMAVAMRIETDRRYRATVVGLLIALAAAASYYLLAPRRVDPDTLWHLATGRYIVEHLSIPSTDVFSWYGIEHHLSWMPQAWLFDVAAFGTWRIGGFGLLYLATAAVTAATVWFVWRLYGLRSGRPLLAVVIAVLTMWGLMPSISPRPQALTFLLLPGLALLLERRKWWWSVPIVLLGVNLHGPVYPLYLAVIAYYALPRRWIVVLACALATAINPAGFALWPYPFTSLPGAGSTPILEFQPVAPVSWPAYLIGLALIFVLLDRRNMPARDLLALIVVIGLSMMALRHMVYLFVLALPLAAPYLRLPSEHLTASTASRPPDSRPPSLMRALDIALIAALGLGVVVVGAKALAAPISPLTGYPVAAARYLRQHHVTRYINEWSDGGYFIFEGMHPMVDGRGDPFISYPGHRRVTIGTEYALAFRLQTDVRALMRRNDITHAVIMRTSPLARVMEQSVDFSPVYRDSVYVIYRFAEKP